MLLASLDSLYLMFLTSAARICFMQAREVLPYSWLESTDSCTSSLDPLSKRMGHRGVCRLQGLRRLAIQLVLLASGAMLS